MTSGLPSMDSAASAATCCAPSPSPAAPISKWSASTISARSRPTRICCASNSVHGRFPGTVTVKGDTISIGNGAIKVSAEKDPAKLPWKDLGVDIALGVHRHLHRQGQGVDASDRRRQARAGVGPGRRRRPHRGLWRQPRQADQGPQGRLQRLVHDQLPRAGRQGAQRRRRHRQGLHDDDPFLHRRPADARHHAQGSLPRPRRGAEHDPDLDRAPRKRSGSCCPS